MADVTGTLDHVGVNVPDLDVAVQFFQDAFGARLIFRFDGIHDPTGVAPGRLGALPDASFSLAMLEIGSARVELLSWRSARMTGGLPVADAPGGTHIGLAVQDIGSALEALRSRPDVFVVGEPVTFDSGATVGLTNAFARTSWGLLIELLQWPEETLA
jgi:catechol 2,3-dioxygenase-like lactoylglutathione lyase family enzyme